MSANNSLQVAGAEPFAVRNVPYGVARAAAHDVFVARVVAAGEDKKFAAVVPPEIRSELPFLEQALSDDSRGTEFRILVEILRRLIGDAPASSTMRVSKGPIVKGIVLTDAEQRAFARGFRSVAPADPLTDALRLAR